MATPPTRVGVKVTFNIPWRGGNRDYSQLWHWTGPSWPDQTHFNTFADNLRDELRPVTLASTTLVEMVGYNAGSFLPVFTKTYGVAGTYTDTGNPQAPGEACMLWRFTTDQRTSKNHPIYLFKWFHHMQTNGLTSPDSLRSGIATTAAGQIADILAGLSDGTNTRNYCGPFGAVAQTGTCNSLLHTREFPT